MPTTAPYGSWRSPITPDLIVAGATSLGQVAWDGPDLYWVEMRPDEGGRMVVVRRSALGEIDDITPKPFSVRTRVHEYGGGRSWWTTASSTSPISPTNASTGRTREVLPGPSPRRRPLRYADGVIDRRLGARHLRPGGPFGAGRASQRHRGRGHYRRASPGSPLFLVGFLFDAAP